MKPTKALNNMRPHLNHLLLIMVSCFSLQASAQETQNEFDGKKWTAPYFLDTPKGWDIERFLIPINFAPSIPYKGVEDIRFTPGWGKKGTSEYWSYAFLWYLDSTRSFDANIMERNLVAYYTGLATLNVDKSKLSDDKLLAAKASIKKIHAASPNAQAFEGTVTILDYMTVQPITLNFLIHVRYCKPPGKTFVFYEASPMPYNDKIWMNLHQLWTNFKCPND